MSSKEMNTREFSAVPSGEDRKIMPTPVQVGSLSPMLWDHLKFCEEYEKKY